VFRTYCVLILLPHRAYFILIYSWFQTFAVIWILKIFFWVFPRRQIVVQFDAGEIPKITFSIYWFNLHQLMHLYIWIYKGWNFNFGNTMLDWILQALLEWRGHSAGRMGPSPTYIHNGNGPSRNGHTQ